METDFKKLVVVVFTLIFLISLISIYASTLNDAQTMSYINETFNPLYKSHIYALAGYRISNSSVFAVNTTTGLKYTNGVDYNISVGDLTHSGTLGWLHTNITVPVSVNYTYKPNDYIEPNSPFALIMGVVVLVLVCTTLYFVMKKFGVF